ncbi:DUF6146 family protein [Mariniphaga sp.]|uniref:DUF6146 family protein n=1 Tax=Mariniphaga sp. TaxID=1954475 RepID=UPI0035614C35
MKQIILIVIAFLFVLACSTQKGVVKIEENKDEMVAVEDSIEYQLETFDSKFETWYALHNNPSQYRSQQYYENWNRQYVNAWNYNATQPGKSSFFEPIVGYEPNIDYGFELNHRLFYYFMYVERVLKIEIMPGGPQSISF